MAVGHEVTTVSGSLGIYRDYAHAHVCARHRMRTSTGTPSGIQVPFAFKKDFKECEIRISQGIFRESLSLSRLVGKRIIQPEPLIGRMQHMRNYGKCLQSPPELNVISPLRLAPSYNRPTDRRLNIYDNAMQG